MKAALRQVLLRAPGPNLWVNASAVGVNATIAEQADGSFNVTVTTASFPGIRVTAAAGTFAAGNLVKFDFAWSGNDEVRTIGFNVGGATANHSTAASGSDVLYLTATGATQAMTIYLANGQVGDTFNVKVNAVRKLR